MEFDIASILVQEDIRAFGATLRQAGTGQAVRAVRKNRGGKTEILIVDETDARLPCRYERAPPAREPEGIIGIPCAHRADCRVSTARSARHALDDLVHDELLELLEEHPLVGVYLPVRVGHFDDLLVFGIPYLLIVHCLPYGFFEVLPAFGQHVSALSLRYDFRFPIGIIIT